MDKTQLYRCVCECLCEGLQTDKDSLENWGEGGEINDMLRAKIHATDSVSSHIKLNASRLRNDGSLVFCMK